MKPTPVPLDLDIITFATHKNYLKRDDLSPAQRAILKAIYGMEMTLEEKLVFLKMSEGRQPRGKGYEEAAIICGTRGGKTMLGAIIATFEAVRWGTKRGDRPSALSELMAPGQTAKGIIIAQHEKGANECRSYIQGNLELLEEKYGGILAETSGQERAVTGALIKLAGPLEIVIYPAKLASMRGVTGLFAILDEIAYWKTAEGSYDQDEKVLEGVDSRFATLARLRPRRIMISSPNEESGALWDAYKRRDSDAEVMVVNAPTWDLYPGIDQVYLDRMQSKKPEAYLRDFGAQFQKAGSGTGSLTYLDSDTVDKCVRVGVRQVPPKAGIEYLTWLDAAFKRDRFFFGVAHLEAGRVWIDHCLAWTPAYRKGYKTRPLDDAEIVIDICASMRQYGCDRVFGDQFADIPLKSRFKDNGILFVESPASNPEKIDAFKNLRGALRAGLVSLPDDDIVKKDLKGLQKKETPGGNVTISAPRRSGCYDDAANVIARLVNRLLPLNSGVDVAAINATAMPSRALPDYKPGEFGGDIMAAVY